MSFLRKKNPFKKTIPQEKNLKNFTLNFQQAIECIIAGKEEMAITFKNEMGKIKIIIDDYAKTLCFAKLGKNINRSLYFLYIQNQIQITEQMIDILEWVLARKTDISKDTIETELFVLADSAAETVEHLCSFGEKLGKIKKNKLISKLDEIQTKSRKTKNLSIRMKRKILEAETDCANITHLVMLADMIGKIAEKTASGAWTAIALSC